MYGIIGLMVVIEEHADLTYRRVISVCYAVLEEVVIALTPLAGASRQGINSDPLDDLGSGGVCPDAQLYTRLPLGGSWDSNKSPEGPGYSHNLNVIVNKLNRLEFQRT
jgi:hypothetical protein